MDDFIIVYVTTTNIAEAREIGNGLISQKLVSCVQIPPKVESIYRWKGEVCNEEESLMTLKTKRSLFQEVAEYIKEKHSYEVPQIVAIPILEGTTEYLSWIKENTKD